MSEIVNLEIIKEFGIPGLILIQIAGLLRAWINANRVKGRNLNLVGIIEELKGRLGIIEIVIDTLKKDNKTEHSELYESYKSIDERTEHANFIPRFETEMQMYINTIVNGFSYTFELENLASVLSKKAKNMFVDILKLGFKRFDTPSLESNFNTLEMYITAIYNSNKLDIDLKKFLKFMENEKELYIIHIKEIVRTKTNGDRQEYFESLCKKYIETINRYLSNI